jgi:hypothetical protein
MLKLSQKYITERNGNGDPLAVCTDLYLQPKGKSDDIPRNAAGDLAMGDGERWHGSLFEAPLQQYLGDVGAQQISQRDKFTRLHAD